MTAVAGFERHRIVRRGQWLTWATLGYNILEAVLSVGAGVMAGSVALVGFGVDSAIEVSASIAGLWRLHRDIDPVARVNAEKMTLRFIGASFLALAVYVAFDAVQALVGHEAPHQSPFGIVIATLSLIVMPLLARAKRRVASQLSSSALSAEAKQTQICAYLSAILLVGLGLNATIGWWWADPVAALVMVPLIAREGILGIRGETVCCDDCAPVLARTTLSSQ